ncbi:hypothetical protein TNCT_157551 [Trichonephila clavata]|uniref:Uncharacterized protein n=1 Tax=Trichonephila clavata TaxID=2740835 RepID=A0A8X6J1Q8_TRICU|nr:hypothetical protein TNCT_157551 [Trichonephila clavata]
MAIYPKDMQPISKLGLRSKEKEFGRIHFREKWRETGNDIRYFNLGIVSGTKELREASVMIRRGYLCILPHHAAGVSRWKCAVHSNDGCMNFKIITSQGSSGRGEIGMGCMQRHVQWSADNI